MQIKWSGIGMTDGRGSIGGNVASRNSTGNIVSVKTIPRQPNTTYQQLWKLRFRETVESWGKIGDTGRGTFQTEADTGDWDRTNSVGVTYQPTAQSLFIQLNQSAFPESFVISEAGTWRTLSSLGVSGLSAADDGTFDVSFSAGSIGSLEEMIVYATHSVSPGQMSLQRSNWKQIARVPSASFSSPLDLSAEYAARIGSLVSGNAVFVKAQIVYLPTGQRAAASAVRAVVS